MTALAYFDSDRRRDMLAPMIRRCRQRDPSPCYRRSLSLRSAVAPGSALERRDGYLYIDVIASTESPVRLRDQRGRAFDEILSHAEGAVDTRAAASVLYGHERLQVIGGIVSLRVVAGQLLARLRIREDAETPNRVKVADLVEAGDLDGISIGYDYADEDAVFDAEARTLTVARWRLTEITITPTQADAGAHPVRDLFGTHRSPPMDPELEALLDTLAAERGRALTERERSLSLSLWGEGKDARAVAAALAALAALPPEPEPEPEPEPDSGQRQVPGPSAHSGAGLERDLLLIAQSHGLTDYQPAGVRSLAEGLRVIRAQVAGRQASQTVLHAGHGVRVTADAADRLQAATADGLRHLAGRQPPNAPDLGLRCGSGLRLIEEHARSMGVFQQRWTPHDLARYALGRQRGLLGGPNNTTAMFPTLLADSMNKLVLEGFNAARTTWRRWAKTRPVRDYKAFTDLALTLGYLNATAQAEPYLEIGSVTTSGGSQVVRQGGLVSLTEEVLVNDDLGEWLSQIYGVGILSDRTVERNLVAAVLGYDYSGAGTVKTTAGAITAQNLGVVRGLFMQLKVTTNAGEGVLVSPDPRLLLVPPTIAPDAWAVTKPAPGLAAASPFIGTLEPIEVPHLEDSSLAGYSAEDWYLVDDPAFGRGARLAHLADRPEPDIEEIDTGAVDARAWKLRFPHKAYVCTKYGIFKADKA